MNPVPSRPTPLGGFWAFLLGGLVLIAALVYARPSFDQSGCSNAGGNGNGTAFADPVWDVRLPFLVLAWLALIAIEQVFPTTWRHRTTSAVALRAASAITVAIIGSCFVLGPLLLLCR